MDVSQRDVDAERDIRELLVQLYTPDEAELWLVSKHPLLGGRVPSELIGPGRQAEVLRLLQQLLDGVYL